MPDERPAGHGRGVTLHSAPTDSNLDRWAYDDEREAKAIARAAEPDIDPDRD